MGSQERFLELMDEIRQIAATQHNYITKQDIADYLDGMDINDAQLEAVYNYLSSLGVVVEGHHYAADMTPQVPANKTDQKTAASEKRQKPAASKSKKAETDRAEINRRLYKRDLSKIETAEGDELPQLAADFLNGSETAKKRFIENRLKLVMKLSKKYSNMDIVSGGIVPIEEVIAEGNLGLLIGIDVISRDAGRFWGVNGEPDLNGIDEVLRIEIIRAIETYVDSNMNGRDMENAMLARINLLHEAAKFMTEELGRIPLKEELSEFTKIPVDEIVQIMGLSEDAKRISSEY